MKTVVFRGLGIFTIGMMILAVMALAPMGGALGLGTTSAAPVAPVASLADGSTANSGIQIQNLGSAEAHVNLEFHAQSGGQTYTISLNIAAGKNSTVYLPEKSEIPANFMGSVVISSDQPIAAIAKTNWANGLSNAASASYTGFQSGNSAFYLPLVLRQFQGQDTRMTVQNTGSTDAVVYVNVLESAKPGVTPRSFRTQTTVGGGSSYTWDQRTDSAIGTGLGVNFIGSATITSTSSVVAVVDVFRPGPSGGVNAVYTYEGFATGGTELVAPLIRRNHFGDTGIQVQNVGNAQTTVTISYKGKIHGKGSDVTASETATVAPNASANFWNGDTSAAAKLPDGFLGAATITSSGGVPIVAMVNDLVMSAGSSAAYNAPAKSAGTKYIVVPLVRNRHTGDQMTTGIQVANVGASAANVTATYAKNPIFAGNLTAAQETDNTSISTGASATFYQGGAYLKDGSVSLPAGFLGSATLVSTNDQPIVAIVNDISLTTPPKWDASIFNGINSTTAPTN